MRKEARKPILAFILTGTLILLFVAVIPLENIYVKESEAVKYLPGEEPPGLIKASNNYVVVSYGTLLKRSEESFTVQFLRFNNNDSAASHFYRVLKEFENAGIRFNTTRSEDGIEAKIFENRSCDVYSLAFLSGDKIFYVVGNTAKIEKVMRWFVSQKM